MPGPIYLKCQNRQCSTVYKIQSGTPLSLCPKRNCNARLQHTTNLNPMERLSAIKWPPAQQPQPPMPPPLSQMQLQPNRIYGNSQLLQSSQGSYYSPQQTVARPPYPPQQRPHACSRTANQRQKHNMTGRGQRTNPKSFVFPNSNYMRNINWQIRGKKGSYSLYRCAYCNHHFAKNVGTPMDLKLHVDKYHCGKKLFKCFYCTYSCDSHKNLIEHTVCFCESAGSKVPKKRFREWKKNQRKIRQPQRDNNHPQPPASVSRQINQRRQPPQLRQINPGGQPFSSPYMRPAQHNQSSLNLLPLEQALLWLSQNQTMQNIARNFGYTDVLAEMAKVQRTSTLQHPLNRQQLEKQLVLLEEQLWNNLNYPSSPQYRNLLSQILEIINKLQVLLLEYRWRILQLQAPHNMQGPLIQQFPFQQGQGPPVQSQPGKLPGIDQLGIEYSKIQDHRFSKICRGDRYNSIHISNRFI